MNTAQDAERAPLVMRFGAFGDIVLLTVLLRHLHERFGKPVDVISSGPWTQPLLAKQRSVGRLFLIRSRRTPYWASIQQRQLVTWLRKRGPGPTWFCDRGLGIELLTRAGIPDHYICDSRAYPWVAGESFADRYIRLGNETPSGLQGVLAPPIPGSARSAHLNVTPQARREADAWLARQGLTGRPFVVIHPGSRHVARRWFRSKAGASKYWPVPRWAQVVAAVREARPTYAILLTGTAAERRLNSDIMRCAAVQGVHNVADDTPMEILLALLERADSVISVDTGPAHAAAALGRPTVVLFGTASPDLYRPGGATTPAVALTGVVEGQQSILGIAADTVITAWKQLAGIADRSTGSVN
jgi:heptosyltransferase-2/heptosyltransferase-3